MFSAHGVPQSYIDAGDPYQGHIEACVDLIAAQLPSRVTVELSYQSRVGPIEWLRPYTDDVLPSLGLTGTRNLVVVPVSFVSEHIETLEEIDIEYKELAIANGITGWRRCPALGTDGAFVEDMADMVAEAVKGVTVTVEEACDANNCGRTSLGERGVEEKKRKVEERRRGGELLNGRLAMVGVGATLLLELVRGESVLDILGLR